MKWFRIPKEKCKQPKKGVYNDWKELLAREANSQCVYCAIHENAYGGFRNFHVEHYRPKSNAKFKKLIHVFRNLFYACSICNTFKGEDWPCDPPPKLHKPCYADPAKIDYSEIFIINSNGEVIGKNIAARYMIEKLYLNRPQLMMERRTFLLKNELEENILEFRKNTNELMRVKTAKAATRALLEKAALLSIDILQLCLDYSKIRPYKPTEILRP